MAPLHRDLPASPSSSSPQSASVAPPPPDVVPAIDSDCAQPHIRRALFPYSPRARAHIWARPLLPCVVRSARAHAPPGSPARNCAPTPLLCPRRTAPRLCPATTRTRPPAVVYAHLSPRLRSNAPATASGDPPCRCRLASPRPPLAARARAAPACPFAPDRTRLRPLLHRAGRRAPPPATTTRGCG
nr:formin-like protein 5 [Aegilops tauschii subsp. strangulata]